MKFTCLLKAGLFVIILGFISALNVFAKKASPAEGIDYDKWFQHGLKIAQDKSIDNPTYAPQSSGRSAGIEVLMKLGIDMKTTGTNTDALVDVLKNFLLTDDFANVRADAAYALGRIGNPRALDALKQALNNDKSLYVKFESAQSALQFDKSSAQIAKVLTRIAIGDEFKSWSKLDLVNAGVVEYRLDPGNNKDGRTTEDRCKYGWRRMAIASLEMVTPKSEYVKTVLRGLQNDSDRTISEAASKALAK
jgi:hypothetical protein